jgi:hypothetical protein
MIHGVLFIPAPKILQIQGKEGSREAGRLREVGEGGREVEGRRGGRRRRSR